MHHTKTHHTHTPAPSDLAGWVGGTTREFFVPAYKPGDTVVVAREVDDGMGIIEEGVLALTITTVTAEQRAGGWGWRVVCGETGEAGEGTEG